jgi:hypothetical protein
MKRIYLIAQAGPFDEEAQRRRHYPVGSVYTQKGGIYAAIASLEGVPGIAELTAAMAGEDKDAAKAASEAVRKLDVPSLILSNGRSLTYGRMCTALRDEARIMLFGSQGDEELEYLIWECPVNVFPDAFDQTDDGEARAWWASTGGAEE